LLFSVRMKINSVRCRGSRYHNEHFYFPLVVMAVMYILHRTNGSITAYEKKNKIDSFYVIKGFAKDSDLLECGCKS
jgi:hypothetical protein